MVSKLVTVGKPEASHILIYPLVPEEGGAAYHSGGRQWPRKSDPDWQAIARWINGQKNSRSARLKERRGRAVSLSALRCVTVA